MFYSCSQSIQLFICQNTLCVIIHTHRLVESIKANDHQALINLNYPKSMLSN